MSFVQFVCLFPFVPLNALRCNFCSIWNLSAQQIDNDATKLLYYVCANYCQQLHDDLGVDSDWNRRWYKRAIIARFTQIFPVLPLLCHSVMILVFVIDVLQKFTNNNNDQENVNPIRVPRNIGFTMLRWVCLVFHFTAIESELRFMKTIWNSIAFSGEKWNQIQCKR